MPQWWLRRWPTRRQSNGYASVATAGIAVVGLNYAAALLGLIGCTTFAVIGGYIAYFHSLRLQTVNLVVGLLAAWVEWLLAVRASGDLVTTVNVYVVVVVVVVAIVAISVTSQVIVHVQGADLDAPDTDPLGGSLNRCAFHRRTHQLLADG